MKTLKKIAAVVATLALTVGMCANCFAADAWGHYFGMNEEDGTVWYEGAEGALTSQSEDGWTATLKSIGWGGCWGAQVFKENVEIKKGTTYNLKCTLSSTNCDKWIYIKIANNKGETKSDMAFAKWVFVKKGSSVAVDETFTAGSDAKSIYFGFGGDYGDRQDSDKDAEIRYSYIPGGLTALKDKNKDGGGDPLSATKVSCSGFSFGEPQSTNGGNENEQTTTKTTNTTTVATGDFTPIACGAAAVVAAAVIVVFARKRETE